MPDSTCVIDGCSNPKLARGWCRKHYRRWQNHGSPVWTTRVERRAESESIPGMKVCARCNALMRLDAFHEHAGRGRKMNHCRDCHASLLAENYQSRADYYQEKHRQWKLANLESVRRQGRIDSSRRRARLSAVEVHQNVSIESVRERDGDGCAYCGIPVWFGETWPGDLFYRMQATLDHVIPISRGGGHVMDNIKIACRDCNTRKYNKTPDEWLKATA